MSVAIIITHLGIGGAERVALDEANELYRRGIPVTLITLKPKRIESSYMDLCVVPESDRVYIHFRSLFDAVAWFRLVRLLRARRPDAVVTHLWYSNTIGRIAARIAGIRTVLSFEHNVYDTVKTKKQFIADRMLQRSSTRIVAVSVAVRESLISHGIKPARIAVIENGIDLSRYRDAKPSSIRDEKDLKDGPVFLFAGRLVFQKAVDVLLDAFALVPEGHLLIAGDGGERTALEGKARNLGLSRRVSFLGERIDIPALMKAADCLVLPSRYEGQGLVIVEALAAGLPAIISDFPAGAHIIRNGENGLVVPREDAVALGQAMNRMRDTDFRKTLVRTASRDAEAFSIATHVDRVLAQRA